MLDVRELGRGDLRYVELGAARICPIWPGMANAPQTTGELFKAKAVTDADIAAAVDAFMADPSTSAFLFGEGYRIDLAEAVRAHEWASVTTANEKATDHLKRAAVRTAILLARPEKV